MSELRTAAEIAMLGTPSERVLNNIIPPMVHPLGKHWDQPPVDCIQVNDTHATMSQQAFDDLADYSHSQPTGVYEGKMWKAHYELDGWVLHWWGPSLNPDCCKRHARKITIV
jgi:hypothetical protein